MNGNQLTNQLHRSVKIALDNGEAATLGEAERMFQQYRLGIEAGPRVAQSPTLQAALLTAVNAGRRCFLGGVEVAGNLHVPLLVQWRGFGRLDEAVTDLQGQLTPNVDPAFPRVVLGCVEQPAAGEFAVQATFDGWSAGVVPVNEAWRLPERREFAPSGVLAGALAVSEAFQHVRGDNAMAGRRATGMSLWRPEYSDRWWECEPGPQLTHLPAKLWLVGLGHLGQAYLWTLGFLAFARPGDVQLVLQDYDALAAANDSTSLLTSQADIGLKKTRAMAAWCEQRGFQATIQERRFDANFQLDPAEPSVALCGVDNAQARSSLENVGFERIIEAGLGNGPSEFLAFQLHGFPACTSAAVRWGGPTKSPESTETLIALPAYAKLAQQGMDQCGLTELAGRSVGAAFVGAVTSTLVIAEAIRIVLGDQGYEVIDGTLRVPSELTALQRARSADLFNPGLTPAIPL